MVNNKQDDLIIELENRVIELQSLIKIYEDSLKVISQSDTLEFCKRTARITIS